MFSPDRWPCCRFGSCLFSLKLALVSRVVLTGRRSLAGGERQPSSTDLVDFCRHLLDQPDLCSLLLLESGEVGEEEEDEP